MISYRDRTFCTAEHCLRFGKGCERSLTRSVRDAAEKWWNPEGKMDRGAAPISVYAFPEELKCYQPHYEPAS